VSTHLDLVRSIYADWERGDFSSTDWAYPQIEFMIHGGTEAGRWTGLAATAAAWRDYLRAWEDFRVLAEEYREVDGERVLVLVQLTGTGTTSGLRLEEIEAKTANVIHLDGGRITKLVIYWDRDRALADLGLEE
jgi:ketosteroid isomerase-like protein